MTPKTFRGRLKQEHLGLDESERVLRSARVTLAASDVFGGFDQARDQAKESERVVSGVLVPSVISTTDYNVLLDPRQVRAFRLGQEVRLPFDWLSNAST